ncbi:MAG: cytochrome c biogenesis protein CcsA [Burkholderiales bacterium]|jgi:ABC-type uncharacterized transport system permease subunit|nr:cytochrome c biogenesis protein CcsA [Burkholderiales bacterium]
MLIEIPVFHLLVSMLYAAGAAARWWTSHRNNAEQPDKPASPLIFIVAVVTLSLHVFSLMRSIIAPDGINFSVGNAASLVAFLCVVVAWASGLMRALSQFSTGLLGMAAVAAIMPAIFPGEHRFMYETQSGMALHIAVAFLAYALFFVAALLALAMASIEKRLRYDFSDQKSGRTPPLLTLERYLFRLILLGFLFLTMTVISGVFFSEIIFGQPFQFTHKTALTMASWVIFGVFLFGHWRFGWRGRRAFYWILTGTAVLLLAYLGYKFIVELFLSR